MIYKRGCVLGERAKRDFKSYVLLFLCYLGYSCTYLVPDSILYIHPIHGLI